MLALASVAMSMSAAPRADAAMAATYDTLARTLIAERRDAPFWVGIGGGPGAGKSTLAAAVAERVNTLAGETISVAIGMDGFHYSRAQLRELDPPDGARYLRRRGAPWTFDAAGCYEALAAAKRNGEAQLPTYSREVSDPVPGGVQLERRHSIVLVEGNYLLMQHDARWAPLKALWDTRWFVACADRDAQRARLIARHLETWNDEKAASWGAGEEGAAARADANDVLNMELIAPCEAHADRVIVSV